MSDATCAVVHLDDIEPDPAAVTLADLGGAAAVAEAPAMRIRDAIRRMPRATSSMAEGEGAAPGVTRCPASKWLVDGYGISAADSGPKMQQPTAGNGGRKCWYVLDVLLCE